MSNSGESNISLSHGPEKVIDLVVKQVLQESNLSEAEMRAIVDRNKETLLSMVHLQATSVYKTDLNDDLVKITQHLLSNLLEGHKVFEDSNNVFPISDLINKIKSRLRNEGPAYVQYLDVLFEELYLDIYRIVFLELFNKIGLECLSDISRYTANLHLSNKKLLCDFLDNLKWIQFEKVIYLLLQKLDYKNIVATPQSRDGGADYIADFQLPFGVEKVIVEVKHYSEGKKVGRETVDKLRGVFYKFNAKRGIIVTNRQFTSDAIAASSDINSPPIELIDGEKLVQLFIDNNLFMKDQTIEIKSLDLDKLYSYFEE